MPRAGPGRRGAAKPRPSLLKGTALPSGGKRLASAPGASAAQLVTEDSVVGSSWLLLMPQRRLSRSLPEHRGPRASLERGLCCI